MSTEPEADTALTLDELRQRNFGTVAEVAGAFFGGMCDERTVRRAIADGQIQAMKVGTKTLIPTAPLFALIDVPAAPIAPPSPAGESSVDAVTAAREILRGALRALEALSGYHERDHTATNQGIDAGHSGEVGGPNVLPHARSGGRGAA
jgi:hypothetical protein